MPTQTIFPTGIDDGETLGAPQLNLTVAPTGFDDGDAVGSPQLNLIIAPVGFADEAFGTPVVMLIHQFVLPAGFADEAVGSPTVVNLAAQFVQVSGWDDTEGCGTPAVALTGPTTIYPVGIG